MSEEKGLIELKPLNIPELFEKGEGVELIINKVKEEVSKHVPDVSSEQGRKDIRKLATMVNKTSSAIDDMGKQLISEQNEIIKRVNGNRKEIRDELEKVRASARKPLLDWEAAEEARKKAEEKADLEKAELKKKADAAIEAQRKSEEAAAKEKAEAERIARIERDNLAKREADKEHRAKINNAAMKALQDNIPQLSSDDAKEIVIAIARNLISNVKISY